ncbi:MAG: glutamate--tRNA ligase [bacterium]|nr:glutamate--tRNA ligase [bacterium]
MEVRTRIAPSPTGYLHLGTARTALFNYLFAKKERGKFVLRIEDTDLERSDKKYEEDIVAGLKWLGIDWDEFYRQSERIGIYEGYIKKLLAGGAAYVSQEKEGERSEVIRFRNPGGKIAFRDIIRGQIEFDTKESGDFVIAKDEQTPLYHFAVVIDDYETKISHVIRGEDHISNTPRQILIQEALGFPRPQYAHLPLILGSDHTKLSKRHGAESIREYKEVGYLPEAMFNFMALLSWHPTDEREIFSKEELIQLFSLERVQKGGAVFDLEKLNWMNKAYIKTVDVKKFEALVLDFVPESWKELKIDWDKIMALSRERMTKLSEFKDLNSFFFEAPEYPKELLRWKGKEDYRVIKKHLEKICELLPASEKIMAYAEKEGRGEVLWPFRVALSGREASPGPFEIAEILGKDETLRRVRRALQLL